MCKMIRVMRHAQDVSKDYEHLPEFRVKQCMFLPAAVAAIDSGSKRPMEWTKHFDFIRGAGYAEGWEGVPLRSERAGDSVSEGLTPAAVVEVEESVPAPVSLAVDAEVKSASAQVSNDAEKNAIAVSVVERKSTQIPDMSPHQVSIGAS